MVTVTGTNDHGDEDEFLSWVDDSITLIKMKIIFLKLLRELCLYLGFIFAQLQYYAEINEKGCYIQFRIFLTSWEVWAANLRLSPLECVTSWRLSPLEHVTSWRLALLFNLINFPHNFGISYRSTPRFYYKPSTTNVSF